MSRLHIPLGKSHTTAHRIRGAVWLLFLFGALSIFGMIWSLGRLLATRNVFANFVPEGTVAMLHLTPTNKDWQKLGADIASLPLVPNRPLTLSHLSSASLTSLTVFFLEDGSRALGLELASPRLLPQDLLDSAGFVVANPKKNLILVSTSPLTQQKKNRASWNFGALFPHYLGSIRLFDEQGSFQGHIFAQKQGYRLQLPPQESNALPSWTEDDRVDAAFSLKPHAWRAFEEHVPDLMRLWVGHGGSAIELSLQELMKSGGVLAFEKGEAGLGVLLEFPRAEETLSLPLLLQEYIALQTPISQPFPLPDGTEAQEIQIQREGILLDEIVIGGTLVHRGMRDNVIAYGARVEEHMVFTNSLELLQARLQPLIETKTRNTIGFIRPLEEGDASLTLGELEHFLRIFGTQPHALSIRKEGGKTWLELMHE